MANSYTQVYLQCVFAVKYRKAVIQKDIQTKVFSVMGNLINETGCNTLIVNGVEDHVHCFLKLKPVVSISELMKVVKAKSSKYINDNNLTPERFEWQRGYGAFSYNVSSYDNVYNYVKNQQKHHIKKKFLDEYLKLLKEFKIEYDEEYLFKNLE